MALREEVANVNFDIDSLNSTIVSTILDVALTLGMCGNNFCKKSVRGKPWYDLDCKLSKKDVKHAFKICKEENLSVLARENYFKIKKLSQETLKDKEK